MGKIRNTYYIIDFDGFNLFSQNDWGYIEFETLEEAIVIRDWLNEIEEELKERGDD